MQPWPGRGGYFVQPQERNEWKNWAEPEAFPFSHSFLYPSQLWLWNSYG